MYTWTCSYLLSTSKMYWIFMNSLLKKSILLSVVFVPLYFPVFSMEDKGGFLSFALEPNPVQSSDSEKDVTEILETILEDDHSQEAFEEVPLGGDRTNKFKNGCCNIQ